MALVTWKVLAVLVVIQLAASKTPARARKVERLFAPVASSKPLRILVVLPFSSHSHYIMPETLMVEMAKRGHQITMFSAFPPKDPIENFSHFDLSKAVPMPNVYMSFQSMADGYANMGVFDFYKVLSVIVGPQMCQNVFSHPPVISLLTGEKQFDVFFTETFGSDCVLALGHKLQIPSIVIAASHNLPWMYEYVGDVDNAAFVESLLKKPSTQGLSSFIERIKNTYYYVASKFAAEFIITRPSEEVIRNNFGKDFPSLSELRSNISLLMVNTHPSLFVAKPTVPRVLPVGGLHLTPPKPGKISKDMQDWLDSAPNGVVYFSLGSIIQLRTLPENLLNIFISALKAHKILRFVWKFDGTEAEARQAGVPDNVKVAKWLPQMEILSHPNVVAFITHGGLMGTTEAIYNGVPMVGIPVFAEQWTNIFRYEKLGIAVRIDHNVATAEDFTNAISTVTSDPSIRRRAKEVSQLFRDRQISPLDSAIWWTEYIVRHGGAPHLETSTAKLPLWQYTLLDVAATVLAALLVALSVIKVLVGCLFRLRTRRPSPKSTKSKSKKTH